MEDEEKVDKSMKVADDTIDKVKEVGDKPEENPRIQNFEEVKVEEKEELYSCKICAKRSDNENDLMLHVKKQHEDKYYDCMNSFDAKEENVVYYECKFSNDIKEEDQKRFDDFKDKMRQKMKKREKFLNKQFINMYVSSIVL